MGFINCVILFTHACWMAIEVNTMEDNERQQSCGVRRQGEVGVRHCLEPLLSGCWECVCSNHHVTLPGPVYVGDTCMSAYIHVCVCFFHVCACVCVCVYVCMCVR